MGPNGNGPAGTINGTGYNPDAIPDFMREVTGIGGTNGTNGSRDEVHENRHYFEPYEWQETKPEDLANIWHNRISAIANGKDPKLTPDLIVAETSLTEGVTKETAQGFLNVQLEYMETPLEDNNALGVERVIRARFSDPKMTPVQRRELIDFLRHVRIPETTILQLETDYSDLIAPSPKLGFFENLRNGVRNAAESFTQRVEELRTQVRTALNQPRERIRNLAGLPGRLRERMQNGNTLEPHELALIVVGLTSIVLGGVILYKNKERIFNTGMGAFNALGRGYKNISKRT